MKQDARKVGHNQMHRKYMRRNILFLGNKINSESRFQVHVWSFSPLVQLLWSKIFANASTFIIKLHGNMWNTIYKSALLQHNNHNISVQHFMDTTIIPTIYKEDRDQCQQALPCYAIDLWHKLWNSVANIGGTTAVHWGQLRHWQTTIIKWQIGAEGRVTQASGQYPQT